VLVVQVVTGIEFPPDSAKINNQNLIQEPRSKTKIKIKDQSQKQRPKSKAKTKVKSTRTGVSALHKQFLTLITE